MTVTIDEHHAELAASACLSLADKQAQMAKECQDAHDAGHSCQPDKMIWDYSIIAERLRQDAHNWRECHDAIRQAIEEA